MHSRPARRIPKKWRYHFHFRMFLLNFQDLFINFFQKWMIQDFIRILQCIPVHDIFQWNPRNIGIFIRIAYQFRPQCDCDDQIWLNCASQNLFFIHILCLYEVTFEVVYRVIGKALFDKFVH